MVPLEVRDSTSTKSYYLHLPPRAIGVVSLGGFLSLVAFVQCSISSSSSAAKLGVGHTRDARALFIVAPFFVMRWAPSCALPEKDQIDRRTRALSHAQKNPHPLSCWQKISFRSNQSPSRNAYEIFRLFCSSQKKREV